MRQKIFFFIVFILTTTKGIHAQWSSNPAINTPICALPGNATYSFHSIEDGEGGTYIAWVDTRDNFTNNLRIYAQHTDSNGVALWTTNGINIANSAIGSPKIVLDKSNGGCIISWTGSGGLAQEKVFAQRLTATGVKTWGSLGIEISGNGTVINDINVGIISNGIYGGAICFYSTFIGNDYYQLYAQAIDSMGNKLWQPNGNLLVDSMYTLISSVDICEDGLGGAYYSWAGNTDGHRYPHLGRVSSIGSIINSAILLTNFSNMIAYSVRSPKIVRDNSGNIIVFWLDTRSSILNTYEIFAQKVNTLGVTQWINNGISFGKVPVLESPSGYDVIPDGSNGAIIAWVDLNSWSAYFNNLIYAQRIDGAGNKKWATNGVLITADTIHHKKEPRLSSSKNGGAIIGWRIEYGGEIRAQQIDSLGANQWGNDGLLVADYYNSGCSLVFFTKHYYLMQDKNKGAIFCYVSPCNSVGTISIQNICSSGYLACTPPEMEVKGNNLLIPSGSTLTSPLNNTNFGSDTIGNTMTRIFKIHNSGTADLSISNISITGTEASYFSYTCSSTSFAADSAILTISFTPLESGFHNAIITIYNNDSDEGNYSFVVKGQAINCVKQAECFWDIDPGFGLGISLNPISPSDSVNEVKSISTIGLIAGYHMLYIRTKDATNKWSLSEPRSIYIKPYIASAEYFWDVDPGQGQGISLNPISTGDSINEIKSISTVGLSVGYHVLYIRTKEGDGKWSLSEPRSMYVKPYIASAEYFWDVDPGQGQGISLNLISTGDSINEIKSISTLGLSAGYHVLYIRTKEGDGKWSLSESRSMYVKSNIVALQYFIDTDPGFANATELPVPNGDSINYNLSINTTGLSYGEHWLYTRTKNSDGKYSLAEGRKIIVLKPLVAAEFFIDTDPGQGNGTAIPIPADHTVNFSGNIQLPALSTGLHKLAIRTLDAEGYWSHPEFRLFYVSPPNYDATAIVAAEFFVDTEPGLGLGLPIGITSGVSPSFLGAITLPSISTGMHTLNMRTKDNLGKWSHVEQRKFYTNPPSHDANTIVAMEYFMDNEPGLGSGIPISITSGVSPSFTGAITLPTITTGIHTMNLRAQDNLGKWSHVEQRKFYANPPTHDATTIVAAEYFMDTDPGLGLGLPISMVTGITSNFIGSIPLPTLSTGLHTLNLRTKDNLGKWCITERRTFFTKPFADATQIVAAQYFIDDDPGFNNASDIPLSSTAATINYCGFIILPTLTSGAHKLFIRTKDSNNTWSLQEPRIFNGIATSNVSITPSSIVSLCLPDSAQLTATTSGGFSSYQWYKNCELIVGATSATYNATDTGNYYVIVTNGAQTQSAAVQVISGTCNSIVNVTCIIEGYWDGVGGMQAVLSNQGEISSAWVCDSIDIELHDENMPYGIIYNSRTLLHQNGIATGVFPPLNANYYIVMKHRNGIETWSANPIFIGGNLPINYNFTTAASQAYGSNQHEVVSGVWAFYSGDINQDENMDLLDAAILESSIANFDFGYFATDLNGDGNVDLLDSPMLEVNVNNFIFSNHP